MCLWEEQTRAYLLQVAAVVGAHVGQRRLLLSVLISLLLGICLLPHQPLLLWTWSEHQVDVSSVCLLSSVGQQCGAVLWGSTVGQQCGAVHDQVMLWRQTGYVVVTDRSCCGDRQVMLWRQTSRLAWRSLSFSALILCCSALSALRFSCRQHTGAMVTFTQSSHTQEHWLPLHSHLRDTCALETCMVNHSKGELCFRQYEFP